MDISAKIQVTERIIGALCLLTVATCAAYFTWDLHQTQIALRASIAPLEEATFKGLKETFDNLNRPCAPGPCGFLPNGTKTEVKIGDAIVQTQLVERTTEPHIVAAMDEFGQTAKHLSSTADSLKGTADALTGTAQGATDTLAEGKRTIAAAQPLLDAYTRSGDDLDVLLKRKAITDILDNVAGMTVHANSISGEFDLVTQKAAGDYLSPQPWWRKIGRFAGDTYDYGALFARHTP